MNGLSTIAEAVSKTPVHFELNQIFWVVVNAFGVGLVLAGSSYWWLYWMDRRLNDGGVVRGRSQRLLGAANQFFLCIGLSATMLLVQENLVRTIAIMAALSLLRFRVKIDRKGTGVTLIFSLLGGMAAGLQEFQMAWVIAFSYAFLLAFLSLLIGLQPEPVSPEIEEKSEAARDLV